MLFILCHTQCCKCLSVQPKINSSIGHESLANTLHHAEDWCHHSCADDDHSNMLAQVVVGHKKFYCKYTTGT